MNDSPIEWDDIDFSFGIEMPEFGPASDDAALSIVEDIFRLPGRELMTGALCVRSPLARKPLPRRAPHARSGAYGHRVAAANGPQLMSRGQH